MRKRRFAGMMLLFAGVLAAAGCAGNGGTGTSSQGTVSSVSASGTRDSQESVRAEISGQGSSVTISGDGVSAEGSVITITEAGTYRFTGTVDEGKIVVSADKDAEVTLIFDGFSITCSDDSPIAADQCGTLTVELADGSENKITDARSEKTAESETASESGTASASGTTSGSGIASASGTTEDSDDGSSEDHDAAVYAKNNLILTGGGSAVISGGYNEGVHAKDDLTVESGTWTVTAANDGIKGKDSVTADGGTLSITSGDDGIESNNSSDKTKGAVTVNGGTISITAEGKGLQAMSRIIVNDGSIDILESKEGMEALTINLNGGIINVKADDDGLNAADTYADSTSETSGFGGKGNMEAVDGCSITVSGGTITIDAAGDGVDSNGDLTVTGGTLYIAGPTSGGDGILDYSGNAVIEGGTVIGTGSAGMLQSFGGDSGQYQVVEYYDSTQSASTEITITDADGNTLASVTPEKDYAALIFSSPELTEGKTVTITTGDSSEQVTISGSTTTVGTAPAGMGGGHGGMGGQAPDGNRSGMNGRPGGKIPDGGRVPGSTDSGSTPQAASS